VKSCRQCNCHSVDINGGLGDLDICDIHGLINHIEDCIGCGDRNVS
jgi:hypothetical protein